MHRALLNYRSSRRTPFVPAFLPLHHKDPFDRMLVAQAQATGWPIVSADPVFDHYGVRRIW